MYKLLNVVTTLVLLLIFVTSIMSCDNQSQNNETNKSTEMEQEQWVTGIGGIFFKCENPEDTRVWYNSSLGFTTNEYGAMFETRSLDNKINYIQWSPFSSKTTYFEPSKKDFMINYRVKNLKKLEEQLKSNGVTVLDTIETYEYGSFLHILDNENNKIELWEPIDVVFTNLYSGTTNIKSTINRIVFKAKNPKELCKWYEKNLGFTISDNKSFFDFKISDAPESNMKFSWIPVPEDSDIFLSENQQLIIGYNIENLEGTLFSLLKSGINVVNTEKIDDGKKVANLIDNDNHQLMLFQSN